MSSRPSEYGATSSGSENLILKGKASLCVAEITEPLSASSTTLQSTIASLSPASGASATFSSRIVHQGPPDSIVNVSSPELSSS